MPDSVSSWFTIVWAALGGIFGVILGVFGIGKLVGEKVTRIESGLARGHERIDEQSKKLDSHDQAIKSVIAMFSREDGEPRFISAVVCGEHWRSCHETLEGKFTRLERDVLAIKTSQDSNLQTLLAEIRGMKEK